MIPYVKQFAARKLFEIANIERLHVIGCPRSGTTLLHWSLICFENTILSRHETDIAHPFLRERLRIARQARRLRGRVHYVTKRDSGWFKDDNIRRLVSHTLDERIGILNIVRDPRDVLTSRHALQREQGPYVTPAYWSQATDAADAIFELLEDYPKKITVRYEDVVRNASEVEEAIRRTFRLSLRPNASSIARVKDNIERFGYRPSAELVGAVHEVRNADIASIGRWRESGLTIDQITTDPTVREKLRAFCARYGYDS